MKRLQTAKAERPNVQGEYSEDKQKLVLERFANGGAATPLIPATFSDCKLHARMPPRNE